VRVFALPGMVMIACPPALTSGGAVGLPLAAPPTVQIPVDQGERGGVARLHGCRIAEATRKPKGADAIFAQQCPPIIFSLILPRRSERSRVVGQRQERRILKGAFPCHILGLTRRASDEIQFLGDARHRLPG
jgi:hypothetical protein